MSLRWKTVIVIATTAATLVGVLYAVSQFIFMRGFQAVEDREASEAVQQVTGGLSDRVKSLHILNHDWAAWDDTYNFVQHPGDNENYIESNPTDTTFVNAELNFILIIDTNRHLVFGKGFDLNSNKEMPIPKSLDEHVFGDALLNHSSVDDSISGIVLLPEGPLLVSSQPIITSQGEGPVMGTIIMAQFLDSRVIDALSEAEHLPLDVVTVNDKNMPPEFQTALASLSADAPVLTRTVNSKSIAGYGLLNDIYGQAALVLKTAISRDIYASGITTMRYFLISLLLMVVVVAALLYHALGKLVISRVHRIGKFVSDIGGSADLTKHLPTEGNDELSRLGRDINTMVDGLQESQQALQTKQQAEEKLRLTIESVVEGIATTDLEGRITDINNPEVLLHGYSAKAEVIGKSALELVAEEDRTRAKDLLKATLETGYSSGAEYGMLKKDGCSFIGEQSTAVLKNPKGKPMGFVISTKDITDRKRAEAELVAQKKLIDRVLANAPDAVLVIGKDRHIVLANKSFYSMFNLLEDEVADRLIDDILPTADISAAISEVLAGSESQFYIEFRQKIADRDKVLVADINVMQEEVLAIFRDATGEREKQESLYLTDRLASVGEMASGVAHEINNPLTGVVGFSELLLERDLPDDIREDVAMICREAKRATEIVKNLLTFARRHTAAKQLTQINAIINDVLALRAYEQRLHNIQVETRFDPGLPEITVDRFQIQQVFLNIVLNAEYFMIKAHNQGKLTITSEKVKGNIKISFADDGLGIPKENLERIFNPFFTTKELGKGTGLGLSICYGVVSAHGGRIYAQSECGKGATFIVEVPTSQAETQPVEPERRFQHLLIEDLRVQK